MKDNTTGAPRKDSGARPASAAHGDEWPQLWFTLTQRPWTSLVVVPALPKLSVFFAARALTEVGQMYEGAQVQMVNAEQVQPEEVAALVALIADRAAAGGRTIISVASPLVHHVAIPIARAADGAVLFVPLGRAQLKQAKRTVESIGAEHFVGSITASSPDRG